MGRSTVPIDAVCRFSRISVQICTPQRPPLRVRARYEAALWPGQNNAKETTRMVHERRQKVYEVVSMDAYACRARVLTHARLATNVRRVASACEIV